MQKKTCLLPTFCAAISLLMVSGAHASLISAIDVVGAVDADEASFVAPEFREHTSVLASFWDNTPRAPQVYLDAQSMMIRTGEDANLKFGVESAAPNPFNFASGAAPAYSPNFSFGSAPTIGFNPDNTRNLPGFALKL